MPAKPLNNDQLQEAATLKRLFKEWQDQERDKGNKVSQEQAAERLGMGQSALNQYVNGKIPLNLEAASKFAAMLGRPIGDFSPSLANQLAEVVSISGVVPQAPAIREDSATYHPQRRLADFELVPAEEENIEVGKIEYWNAKGSCGGGVTNYDEVAKGMLVKEYTFFSHYNVRPSNLFAIYADGNSMADYIVDGDIVIFDRSRRTPISGEIFLIQHPDGLRIKQLRREIDGTWVLESRNSDKRRFPDERIEPEQVELLQVLGQFVYRQGG